MKNIGRWIITAVLAAAWAFFFVPQAVVTVHATAPTEFTYTARVIWNDNNNELGNRPGSLDVYLLSGGEVKKQITLNVGNEWSGSFIVETEGDYTVALSSAPDGYTSSTSVEERVTTITLTHVSSGSYAINVTGGTADHTSATAGTEVTITAGDQAGMAFKCWQNAENLQFKRGSSMSDSPATFIMGNGDVSVTAVYGYRVHATSPESGGTVSADKEIAQKGENVKITASPAEGYIFKDWDIESPDDLIIYNGQFVMPAEDVYISAKFEKNGDDRPVKPNKPAPAPIPLISDGDDDQDQTEGDGLTPPPSQPPAPSPKPAPAPEPEPDNEPGWEEQRPVTVSKKPTGAKTTVDKNKVTVTWNKIKDTKKNKALRKKIKKVEIQYSTDPDFKGNVATKTVGMNKTKVSLKGLEKNTVYYIRVRYISADGVSEWSATRRVKTKK